MSDRPKCAETVYPPGGWGHHQCTRYALPGQKYCKQHSPEYKAEQERKRRERFKAAWAMREKSRENGAVHLLRSLGYTVIEPDGKGGKI
jgi:hypothetical protein